MKKSNLINEHAFNCEPIPLLQTLSMAPHSVCINRVLLYVQNLTEMSHFKGNDMVIAIKLKNHERKKLIIHGSLLNFDAKQSTPYEVISPLATLKSSISKLHTL